MAVIADVCARVAVDPRRIYLAGMSNGATMAARFACEHASAIAAFAQVAGTAAVDVANRCRPPRPLPILQLHGSADEIAPYAGGQRRSFRGRPLVRGRIGPSIGVDAWAQTWVDVDHADTKPVMSSPAPDITVRTWRGATPASDVVFYRIEGGGHTWPGNRLPGLPFLFGRTSRSINATREIWQFLSAHIRPA